MPKHREGGYRQNEYYDWIEDEADNAREQQAREERERFSERAAEHSPDLAQPSGDQPPLKEER